MGHAEHATEWWLMRTVPIHNRSIVDCRRAVLRH
jgi:hypothetical protein